MLGSSGEAKVGMFTETGVTAADVLVLERLDAETLSWVS
jgi:hypothetical protein